MSKKATSEAKPKPKAKTYKVADGRSVCCATRILSEGATVDDRMFHADLGVSQSSFAAHLESGTIVEA